MDYAISPPPVITLEVISGKPFPVRRIFCVGQNYADHVREMGNAPDEPFFFMKPAYAIVPHRSIVPYPPGTTDLQPEVELVVALHKGGRDIPVERVDRDYIFGYGVGLDMTRRDVQRTLKAKGRPWEMAKAFDHSAPCGALTPASRSGIITRGKIELSVNGEIRQGDDVSRMILKTPELIHRLSAWVELQPGDILFTGTPAGVAPVARGDVLQASVAGLAPLAVTIG